jgi:hypothetical protein
MSILIDDDARETKFRAIAAWREQEAQYRAKALREGGNPAAIALANTCGKTARTIEMELEDGISRCVCCLKPFSARDQLPYWERAIR